MKHQDYMDVATSGDRSTFEARLLKFANNMQFGLFSAALAVEQPGRRTMFEVIGNTPEAFMAASRSLANTRRDPVRRRLKSWHVPFVYDQAFYVAEGAADLWELQAPFGYETGIAMALHMPGGRHFLFGVDRPEPLPAEDARLTRLIADLQLLAVYAQEAAVRLLIPDVAVAESIPKLTARELEVLRWSNEGKSAWAVGEIMALSEHTVNFHLANAARKLGVSGKHMAIMRAISLALL